MTREPLGECDGCGADLYPNEPHDCPVTGSTVTAEPMENTGQGGREMDATFWIGSTRFDEDWTDRETVRNSAEQIELGYRVRSWFRYPTETGTPMGAWYRTRHVPGAIYGAAGIDR